MRPLVESERLYVGPSRLCERLSRDEGPLVVIDVGLGAGSNAAAALRARAALPEAARPLELISFERDLTALALALRPEHAAHFGFEGASYAAAQQLLQAQRYESTSVRWRLVLGDALQGLSRMPEASADIVFWDPFSPRANPLLWTVAAFRALRRVCREGATVHTYSGATSTRTALLLAGFAVGFGEPIGDKTQTTTAAVRIEDLARPLDARWFQRLARSSAPLPVDAPEDALATLAALPQFRPGLAR
jgi:queuine tRNA-ribosyltransferase